MVLFDAFFPTHPPGYIPTDAWEMGDLVPEYLFVGHGHFSRSVMTRWMELPISEGIRVSMAAASISVCGFEHGVRQITALGLTGHVNPCLPP